MYKFPWTNLSLSPVTNGNYDNLIHIHLGATYKLVFLVGVTVGLMAAKSELLSAGIDGAAIAARGYEYDAENDCVVVRQATCYIQ